MQNLAGSCRKSRLVIYISEISFFFMLQHAAYIMQPVLQIMLFCHICATNILTVPSTMDVHVMDAITYHVIKRHCYGNQTCTMVVQSSTHHSNFGVNSTITWYNLIHRVMRRRKLVLICNSSKNNFRQDAKSC